MKLSEGKTFIYNGQKYKINPKYKQIYIWTDLGTYDEDGNLEMAWCHHSNENNLIPLDEINIIDALKVRFAVTEHHKEMQKKYCP